MRFYIVIPANNEEGYIGRTLQSLINQSLLPTKVVVVDDNSTDTTASIVNKIAKEHPWISLVSNTSSEAHLPGGKIINAFYKGYDSLDFEYDVICKYDADVVFPENYLETLTKHYHNNSKLGIQCPMAVSSALAVILEPQRPRPNLRTEQDPQGNRWIDASRHPMVREVLNNQPLPPVYCGQTQTLRISPHHLQVKIQGERTGTYRKPEA